MRIDRCEHCGKEIEFASENWNIDEAGGGPLQRALAACAVRREGTDGE